MSLSSGSERVEQFHSAWPQLANFSSFVPCRRRLRSAPMTHWGGSEITLEKRTHSSSLGDISTERAPPAKRSGEKLYQALLSASLLKCKSSVTSMGSLGSYSFNCCSIAPRPSSKGGARVSRWRHVDCLKSARLQARP